MEAPNSNKSKLDAEKIILKNSLNIEGQNIKKVKGFEFKPNKPVKLDELIDSFKTTGLQASNVGLAIEILKEVLETRKEYGKDFKLFLGYTSNMVSSGIRDIIRFLVQYKLVDVIVSAAGGIEEDIIKCLSPTYLGSFSVDDEDFYKKGYNRIGNMIMPNNNYCKFENFLTPLIEKMVKIQKIWSPSEIIKKLGEEINSEESICYWSYVNDIPIYSPALIDGSFGDILILSTLNLDGTSKIVIDTVSDLKKLNLSTMDSKKTAALILGGGLIKHQILNANLMKNGADYCVLINTGSEYDGSDSGASLSEAISWGKLSLKSKKVKICCDASIVFPLIVAGTFVPYLNSELKVSNN